MSDLRKFVMGKRYQLAGSGVTSTATRILVTGLVLPDTAETSIVMSMFGTKGQATLEPKTSNVESISFTGITQNGDGTAYLEYCTRGLGFTSPYTEDSALKKSHSGGAALIFSNTPAFYDDFANKSNDESIVGVWTFDSGSTPRLSADRTYGSGEEAFLATKGYADSLAIAGAPYSSDTQYGITKVSVAPASTGSPIAVGDNDPRVPTQSENNALVGTAGSPSTSNPYVTKDDTVGTGSVIRVSAFSGLFGDGSSGSTTITSGTTILTSDQYYTNLQLNSGAVLDPGGYRIFVSGTLTRVGTGKIARFGGNGVNGTAGVAGVGGVSNGAGGAGGAAGSTGTTGTIFGGNAGSAGGIGGNGADNTGTNGGANGVPTSQVLAIQSGAHGAFSGSGGFGGLSGGASTTGYAGTRGLVSVFTGIPYNLFSAGEGLTFYGSQIGYIKTSAGSGGGGGGGGGSGNGAGSGAGGGGGGGGSGGDTGNILVVAKNIVDTSASSTFFMLVAGNGGAGGAGGSGSTGRGGGGGGGGGGNAGICTVIYASKSGSFTHQISGGTGGTGGASGGGNATAGISGSNGFAGKFVEISLY